MGDVYGRSLTNNDSGMGFDDIEESQMDQQLMFDSPRGSTGDSSVFFDEENLLEDDLEDQFLDAEDEYTAQLNSENMEQMRNLQDVIILDCHQERLALPHLRDSKIKASAIWNLLKDLIGQDLSKISMPVVINEPLTLLQKTSELNRDLNMVQISAE